MASPASVKVIKGGKTDEAPTVRRITLRGVRYTIREIDTVEYDELVEQVQDLATQTVRYDKLLRAMVARCASPMPSKPLPYPVYRTLQNIVEEMHYTDLVDEGEKPDEETEGEGETVPNS